MLPFYLQNKQLWQPALRMILRLKLFFVSILLVYVFFSPVPVVAMFSAHLLGESLIPGLFRISVLILIIFAVNLYLKNTTKEQILSSLIWLFYPLNYIKININRMALRAVMTLEYIEYLNQKLAEYQQLKKQRIRTSDTVFSFRQYFQAKKQALFHLIRYSGIILHEILAEAESTSGKKYTIDCLPSPVLTQFFIPMVLCLLLFLTL